MFLRACHSQYNTVGSANRTVHVTDSLTTANNFNYCRRRPYNTICRYLQITLHYKYRTKSHHITSHHITAHKLIRHCASSIAIATVVEDEILDMAPYNFIKDVVENRLDHCVILPPKPFPDDFKLFQSLEVKLGKDDMAEFKPLSLGIDEKFLRESDTNNEKITTLQGFLGRANENRPLEDINESNDFNKSISGNLGATFLTFFNGTFNAGKSATSHYDLHMTRMSKTSIALTKGVEDFLKDCIPDFCDYSPDIRAGFQRNQTRLNLMSENISCGVAFVTSYITGSVYVKVTDFNNVNGSVDAGIASAGVDAEGGRDRTIDSDGIVGIRVYFVHLVKNEKLNSDSLKILSVSPVNKNNGKQLKRTLKRITAKCFMKIFTQ